jgi:hypothetical protein
MNNGTWTRGAVLWMVAGVVWLGAAATGLGMMAAYANRPGAAAQAPAEWPTHSRLQRRPGTPALVMLAHPRCDCTRASLAELAELMARMPHRADAFLVFITPPGATEDWGQTELWRRAVHMPGVTAVRDDGGVEAARFGAQTSGQTLLYDASGRLVFDGGTTGARGHVGENAGFDAIAARLGDSARDRASTPVYGCDLFAPQDSARSMRVKSHGN